MGAMICSDYDDSADVLKAIGGLMMGLNPDATELDGFQINALGGIINYVGDVMEGLNREYEEGRKNWTPGEAILKQFQDHLRLKNDARGAILFFRFGNDHVAFFDDAYLLNQYMGLPLRGIDGCPQCRIAPDMKEKCVERLNGLSMTVAFCEACENVRTEGDSIENIEEKIFRIKAQLMDQESKSRVSCGERGGAAS